MEEDKKQSAETANPHSTKDQSWSDILKEMGIDEEEDKEEDEIMVAMLLELESPKRAEIG